MKVAFVNVDEKRNCNVTRGAGYVAAAVMQAGHELEFFDSYFHPLQDIADQVACGTFDILMVSSMSMVFPDAVKLIRMVKAKKNIPVIYGGIHATQEGAHILHQHPDIDFLCIGEGMEMVKIFLQHLGTDKVYDTPNLAYRREGRIQINPVGPADDLAQLPPFPWHFFAREKVVHQDGFIFVSASRGCPFGCTYCCNQNVLQLYGKSFVRYRPIPDVIAELQQLKEEFNPRLFYFFDELVLCDARYAGELFREVQRQIGLPFGFMARPESITRENADMLAATGGQYISLGLECGNEQFRYKELNRHISNDHIRQAFSLLKERNIYAVSMNIIGFPYDHDDRLTEDTIHLNEEIQPDLTYWSIFYPFPGTKMYKYCIDKDLIDPAKQADVWSVREDSILRGVHLADKRLELLSRFNHKSHDFMVQSLCKTT